jgi:8-hydroxy-5-deazaflavin:NADPH oxidoreductase
MATAIIGIGNIGGTLARHLVRGGEPVVLAAKDEANAAALAQELGDLARAASVEEAIAEADAVVFAVWLDTIRELTAKDADLLEGKVVVDPSNPIGVDENGEMREGIRHARGRLARKRREPRASAGSAVLRRR